MEKGGIGCMVEKHSLASMKMAEGETDCSLKSNKMELLQFIKTLTMMMEKLHMKRYLKGTNVWKLMNSCS